MRLFDLRVRWAESKAREATVKLILFEAIEGEARILDCVCMCHTQLANRLTFNTSESQWNRVGTASPHHQSTSSANTFMWILYWNVACRHPIQYRDLCLWTFHQNFWLINSIMMLMKSIKDQSKRSTGREKPCKIINTEYTQKCNKKITSSYIIRKMYSFFGGGDVVDRGTACASLDSHPKLSIWTICFHISAREKYFIHINFQHQSPMYRQLLNNNFRFSFVASFFFFFARFVCRSLVWKACSRSHRWIIITPEFPFVLLFVDLFSWYGNETQREYPKISFLRALLSLHTYRSKVYSALMYRLWREHADRMHVCTPPDSWSLRGKHYRENRFMQQTGKRNQQFSIQCHWWWWRVTHECR